METLAPPSSNFAFALSSPLPVGGIRLPTILSDHMVLQRSETAAVWGFASPHETISISLGPVRARARSDRQGRWKTALDLRTVAEGPFDMIVEGTERLVVSDVLIGEVWLCSGQSNMAYTLDRATGAAEEMARSANSRLRQFRVGENKADSPLESCTGSWVLASPATCAAFSAVGHYFSRSLQTALGAPVGIIVSARAGTNAIAWISTNTLEADEELKSIRDESSRIEKEYPARKKAYVTAMAEWENTYQRLDRPTDPAAFANPQSPDKGWSQTHLPGHLRDQKLPDSGATWFGKRVSLSSPSAHPVTIDLGGPHDFDAVYWNGHKIGENTEATATGPTDTKRYLVPHEFLAQGDNLLAVRLFTPTENAGFSAQPFMNVGPVRSLLDTGWCARPEFELPPLTEEARRKCPGIPSEPDPYCGGGRLYNAMIAPIVNTTLAGVLWYQGEQDTGKTRALYHKILQALTRDWRKNSGNETPFVICQLPNFGPKLETPGESAWAEIRQAQLDAFPLPKTAVVVLIDCGDADVHPPNKKPVGERAAAVALRAFYDRKAIPISPLFRSMKVDGQKLTIQFEFAEDGLKPHPLPAMYQPTYLSPKEQPLVLTNPDGELQGFAVCGIDRKWKWADARIEGSAVIVQCSAVPQPIAVRYAWADNPTCNLDEVSGLPVSPFEASVQKNIRK